ncbi:MAG: hypothetical protein IJ621_01830 [Paludibacteraceae bacterium]|nr:hypothetical protein [Paludibacteraceae bacterium]
MKSRLLTILLLLCCGFTVVRADDADLPKDSLPLTLSADSLPATDTMNLWVPNPSRATWLAVIVPGLGQIYNRSYWKLPIVYGAFMGCAYAISWNASMYNDYKEAYRDILLDETLSDDPTRSYNAILPPGYTIESMGGRSQYTSTLNSRQNRYRRYRDISIAATVAVYVLSIIDAYVDAQLFDFDISPNLSLNVQPQLNYDPWRDNRSAELKLALNF